MARQVAAMSDLSLYAGDVAALQNVANAALRGGQVTRVEISTSAGVYVTAGSAASPMERLRIFTAPIAVREASRAAAFAPQGSTLVGDAPIGTVQTHRGARQRGRHLADPPDTHLRRVLSGRQHRTRPAPGIRPGPCNLCPHCCAARQPHRRALPAAAQQHLQPRATGRRPSRRRAVGPYRPGGAAINCYFLIADSESEARTTQDAGRRTDDQAGTASMSDRSQWRCLAMAAMKPCAACNACA